MVTVLKSKNVVTKKQHQCLTCLRLFPSNTKMNYWAGLYEGDFNSHYCCMTCVEILNMTGDTEWGEGYVKEMIDKDQTPEQLLETLNNKIYENK